jgi:aminomethyltransferase
VSETMLRSPLHQQHVALDAHFGAFSGWEMPLRYSGTLFEHTAVRQACGVFDVSHLGVVDIVGPDAAAVVATTFTNDVTQLADGDAQYSLCLTDAGHVTDDLIVYRLGATRFRAIPNAANTQAVIAALERTRDNRDVVVTHKDRTVILAVQGSGSLAVVRHVLTQLDVPVAGLDTMNYMTCHMQTVGDSELMLARTGYTGEYGFEIVSDAATGQRVWQHALAAGAVPCGLAARDTLRLEMGYPLHGHELSSTTTPLRRNVAFALRTTNQTFTGAAALAAAPTPTQVMRGVKSAGKRPFRDGMTVYVNDTAVGVLTSGGISPTLGVAIGVGMIDDTVPLGADVTVDVRGSRELATVTRPPFVNADPRRLPQA